MEIQKIIENLFPKDKLLHFFYGFFVFYLTAILVSNIAALGITLGVAILKEASDLCIKRTRFDWVDIVFTLLSGSLITLLW